MPTRGDKHVCSTRSTLQAQPANDADRQETREWMDALSAVIESRGPGARALPAGTTAGARPAKQHRHAVLGQHRLRQHHRADQEEARSPGNIEIEERLRAYMRWNAMAMVVKANRHQPGWMAATWAATLARLPRWPHVRRRFQPLLARRERGATAAICLYIQGHVSPGIVCPRLTWKAG